MRLGFSRRTWSKPPASPEGGVEKSMGDARPAAVGPSSAWGDVVMAVGMAAVWLVLARWALPAMGFPACTDGGCGTPTLEELQPPASGAASVPETVPGDRSR